MERQDLRIAEKLASVRKTIAKNRNTMPHFDTARRTRNLEKSTNGCWTNRPERAPRGFNPGRPGRR